MRGTRGGGRPPPIAIGLGALPAQVQMEVGLGASAAIATSKGKLVNDMQLMFETFVLETLGGILIEPINEQLQVCDLVRSRRPQRRYRPRPTAPRALFTPHRCAARCSLRTVAPHAVDSDAARTPAPPTARPAPPTAQLAPFAVLTAAHRGAPEADQ